jgi:D-3-phosphoglycerate dehydrogenase/(S)-sulfolactate dehydrogenase
MSNDNLTESTDPQGHPDVAVVEDVEGDALDALQTKYVVRHEPGAWAEPARLGLLAGTARALVVRNRTQVTRQLLQAAPRLLVVARAGVGLDNVDVAAADELGVVVVAAVGANAPSVAEHALAMALALARDLVGLDASVRDGRWDRAPGLELAGRTWGVIGLGATGRATAALAAAIGMRVVGFDPFIGQEQLVDGVERVTKQVQLLEQADVVSLHLALSDQTRGLVDRLFLASMRPGAMLINVARGELVDEEALLAALDSGRVGGAGLDVRTEEPPTNNQLTRHPRCLSTPHVAGITGAAQNRVVSMIAADVDRVLQGEEPLHPVGHLRRPDRT